MAASSLDRRKSEETQNEQGVRNVIGNVTGCCCIRKAASMQTRKTKGINACFRDRPYYVGFALEPRVLVRRRIKSKG